VGIENRGFAAMDLVTRREIASKGGKAAQESGKANKWTPGPDGTAVKAGQKGGKVKGKNGSGTRASKYA